MHRDTIEIRAFGGICIFLFENLKKVIEIFIFLKLHFKLFNVHNLREIAIQTL